MPVNAENLDLLKFICPIAQKPFIQVIIGALNIQLRGNLNSETDIMARTWVGQRLVVCTRQCLAHKQELCHPEILEDTELGMIGAGLTIEKESLGLNKSSFKK